MDSRACFFFGDGSQIDKTGTEPVGSNALSSSFINFRSMTEKKHTLIELNHDTKSKALSSK